MHSDFLIEFDNDCNEWNLSQDVEESDNICIEKEVSITDNGLEDMISTQIGPGEVLK